MRWFRTRAARRWLTALSVLLGIIGVVGLLGGFEARTYDAPPEVAPGTEVTTTRFTYRLHGAEWVQASDGVAPALRLSLEVTNTSPDTTHVPTHLIITRLPDGSVLPADGDYASVMRDGPSEFLPLVRADATITYRQGLPDERPDEVEVFLFDEEQREEEGVYTEFLTGGEMQARVTLPVEESDF